MDFVHSISHALTNIWQGVSDVMSSKKTTYVVGSAVVAVVVYRVVQPWLLRPKSVRERSSTKRQG